MSIDLKQLGWNPDFAKHLAALNDPQLVAARVLVDHGRAYIVATEGGEFPAEVSGRFRYQATERSTYPAAGDWVAVTVAVPQGPAIIHAVLPRRSAFSRKAAGDRVEEQVVAANIDTVFVVVGLDGNFNARRIERYVVMAWESGATPVIVLTKSDLANDVGARTLEAENVAIGTSVHAVSAIAGTGLESLRQYLRPEATVALLGSSGAGKSTLINYLLGGDVQPTQAVREDDSRGRHTTTHRQLFLVPGRGMVVDTPGMRELGLWDADEGVSAAFHDVEGLAEGCRFRDCGHTDEPGCAVRDAVRTGALAEDRLAGYFKLRAELAYQERKVDKVAQSEHEKKWRSIHKTLRDHYKSRE